MQPQTQQMHMHPLMMTPNIHDVKPFDPATDTTLFNELFGVLQKHGAVDRFGICLLHNHFEIKPDEMVVERTDSNNRIQQCTVEPKDDEREYIQTQWTFEDGGIMSCDSHCDPSHVVYNFADKAQ